MPVVQSGQQAGETRQQGTRVGIAIRSLGRRDHTRKITIRVIGFFVNELHRSAAVILPGNISRSRNTEGYISGQGQ